MSQPKQGSVTFVGAGPGAADLLTFRAAKRIADADIVIYDPAAEQTLSAETHHMNVDYSAYEGKRITGQVETVLSRGELVIDGRKFTGRAGHGMYTPRATCQYLD